MSGIEKQRYTGCNIRDQDLLKTGVIVRCVSSAVECIIPQDRAHGWLFARADQTLVSRGWHTQWLGAGGSSASSSSFLLEQGWEAAVAAAVTGFPLPTQETWHVFPALGSSPWHGSGQCGCLRSKPVDGGSLRPCLSDKSTFFPQK